MDTDFEKGSGAEMSAGERAKLAVKAVDITIRKILDQEDFIPNEALRLAHLYACYTVEHDLYEMHFNTAEPAELDEMLKRALGATGDGDYRKLKRFILGQSARLSGEVEEEESLAIDMNEEDIELLWEASGLAYQRKLYEKLNQMVSVMPDSGPPLKTPKPAWRDEEIINSPEPRL